MFFIVSNFVCSSDHWLSITHDSDIVLFMEIFLDRKRSLTWTDRDTNTMVQLAEYRIKNNDLTEKKLNFWRRYTCRKLITLPAAIKTGKKYYYVSGGRPWLRVYLCFWNKNFKIPTKYDDNRRAKRQKIKFYFWQKFISQKKNVTFLFVRRQCVQSSSSRRHALAYIDNGR